MTLVAVFVLNMGTVNTATAQTQRAKYKNQPTQAQIGQFKLNYIAPDNFRRIDGLARDIDEMLMFFTPNNVQNIAIFADPTSWERFYNELYGDKPRDLKYYATVTTGSDASTKPLTPKRLSRYYSNVLVIDASMRPLNDGEVGSQFLENGQNAATSFEIIEQGPNHLTFKANLGQMKKSKEGELTFNERYNLISSTISVGSNIICLNLLFNNKGVPEEEALKVALEWRNKYLELTKPFIYKLGITQVPEPVLPVTVPLPLKLTDPDKNPTPTVTIKKRNGDKAVLTGKLPAEKPVSLDEKELPASVLEKPEN